MNQMKSQSLIAALSLVFLVSACGKSMSLQVNGATDSQKQTSTTVDTTKGAEGEKKTEGEDEKKAVGETVAPKELSKMESLEKFSLFDETQLEGKISETSLARRATLQVAPKNAITEVTALKLTLVNAVVKDLKNATLCIVETECRPLADLIQKASSTPVDLTKSVTLELDLREVFGLEKKTSAELADWIYSNSTAFADPGYRKFRFTLEGISAIDSGSLQLQVITNTQLPKDFWTVPTCYENGDDDRFEAELN